MRRMAKLSLSHCLYFVGAIILFVLSVFCMVAFIRAVSAKEEIVEKPKKALADSMQVEQLRMEVNDLRMKVDSLITLTQKVPKVKYWYLKPRKDSCVIELNVNKRGESNREKE